MVENYDFCGWATRNDIRCSDGRTIRKNAFKDCDGKTVPLVWNHQHNETGNVLGHALLENRAEGVYTYGFFNQTPNGIDAKELVDNGDIKSLSIYANQLKQNGGDVIHGAIREVSLVLAGANPGAYIESVIAHGEASEEEAVIYSGDEIDLKHAEATVAETPIQHVESTPETKKEENPKMEKEKTVADVYEAMTEEQKLVVAAIVGEAVSSALEENEKDKEDEKMKHNVFENDTPENTLSHDEMNTIFSDAKRMGSLKESVLQHTATYGIDNIAYLFPDSKKVQNVPGFVKRDTNWVDDVMSGVKHIPFSRIKSMQGVLTADEARAKGYVKGHLKAEEVITMLKRETTPTTIYKKQKLDRDDIVDITDFDVVAWLKTEMRIMLDEEIARAILVGDGRLSSSDDKINPLNIRPIWTDDDIYTIKQAVTVTSSATAEDKAKEMIRQAVKSRKNYKGSGNPVLFTTEDVLTECLLLEDLNGRVIYDSIEKLATAMRVSKIVTVPVMENLSRTDSSSVTHTLMGIIVNLTDYNVGADKGGAINMFDDFDINYNQQKYLIETRCSGALVQPYSAIALECVVSA